MTVGKPRFTVVSLATYEAIERVLCKAALGEGDRWLAAMCRRIDHWAARAAAAKLRTGNRRAGLVLLEQTLARMAEAGVIDAWRAHRVGDFKGRAEPGGPTMG